MPERIAQRRARAMWEDDVRPIVLVLVLVMMLLLVVALVAHFLIRRCVRDVIARSVAKQLQMDALAFKTGTPLRQLGASPATTNRTLIKALVGRV